MEYEDIFYGEIKTQVTGSRDFLANTKVVDIPFDKYIIKIRLSDSNEFVGIEEVNVNKDFFNHAQRILKLSTSGYLDIEQYYLEEEEEEEEVE